LEVAAHYEATLGRMRARARTLSEEEEEALADIQARTEARAWREPSFDGLTELEISPARERRVSLGTWSTEPSMQAFPSTASSADFFDEVSEPDLFRRAALKSQGSMSTQSDIPAEEPAQTPCSASRLVLDELFDDAEGVLRTVRGGAFGYDCEPL